MARSIATLLVKLGADAGGLRRGLRKAEKQLGTFAASARRLGSQLTRAVSLPLAGVGGVAVKLASDFESSMQKIVGLVGVAQEQVESWRDEVLKLAAELGRSPRELAEALYFITSAGLRGSEALETLRAAAQASAAGLGSITSIADAVTSALNAYAGSGLDAARATALLVAGVREGKADAASFAGVVGRILPVASELGVSFDQVVAGIAAMTRTGLDAAEASTSLSSILRALLRPSEQAADLLEGVGLSADEVRQAVRERGLLAVLKELRGAFGENQEAFSRLFEDSTALVGALTLLRGGGEEAQAVFDSLAATVATTLTDALGAMEGTIAQSLARLRMSATAALVDLGNAIAPALLPVFERVGAAIAALAEQFRKLPAGVQRAIVAVGGLAVVVGPVITLVGALAAAIAAIGAPAAAAVGAVVAALGALAANLGGVRQLFAGARAAIVPALEAIRDLAGQVAARVKAWAAEIAPVLAELGAMLQRFWLEHGAAIVARISAAWRTVRGVILAGLDALLGGIKAGLLVLTGHFHEAWRAIRETGSKVLSDLADAVRGWVLVARAEWAHFQAAWLVASRVILRGVQALGEAFLGLPFISPTLRAAAVRGLTAIEASIGAIGVAIAAAEGRADSLTAQAAKLLGPVGKLQQQVKITGEAFLAIPPAADQVTHSVSGAFQRWGREIQGTLSGGFGRAVEEGIAFGEQQFRAWRRRLESEPIRIRIEPIFPNDLDRRPDTSGAVP